MNAKRILDEIAVVLEHRVTGAAIWMLVLFLQDVFKNGWVLGVLNEPSTIVNVPFRAWVLLAVYGSIPALIGLRTYMSGKWSANGGPHNEPNTKPDSGAAAAGAGAATGA